MRRKSLLRSSAVYAFGLIMPKLMSVILLPLFTRHLGPEDYGILSYTNSVVEFIRVFSVLSLNSYVLRFWMDYAPEDDAGRRRLVGAVFSFLCVFNLVIFGGGFLLGPLAVSGFGVQVPFFPYFALALVANFFNILSIMPLAVFRLMDRPGAYIGLTISRSLLNYAVAYVLVIILDWGVIGMYVAQVVVFALYAPIYLRVIWRHGSFSWDLGLVRQGLMFSLPLLPGALSHLVISVIDRVMLEAWVSLDRLGLYSIGYTLGFFSLMVLIHGGYRAFEPAIFQAWSKEGFEAFWRKIRGVFVSLLLVAAVGVGLLGRELLELLTTERFHEAYRVIPVVALAASLRGFGLMFTVLLVAAKRTRIATGIVLVGAAVNVVTNLVLIPWLGIVGAAWSSVVAYAVMAPLAYVFCERLGLLQVRDLLVRDAVALGVAIALVGGVVFGLGGEPSWGLFVIKVLLIMAYAAAVAVNYRVWRYLR